MGYTRLLMDGFAALKYIKTEACYSLWQAIQVSNERPVLIKFFESSEKYPYGRSIAVNEQNFHTSLNLSSMATFIEQIEIDVGSALIIDLENYNLLTGLLKKTKFNPSLFLKISIALANALQEFHRNKIFIGIIQPSDLICSEDFSTIKFVNFLYAKTETSSPHLSPHHTNDPLMPINIAPELIMKGDQTTTNERSDLYACGVVLYQLFTGKQISRHDGEVLEGDIVDLATMLASLSTHSFENPLFVPIEAIIYKLLSKNPDQRYRSILGLIYDLNYCQQHSDMPHELAGFFPGMHDVATSLNFSAKLYGRTNEISSLIENHLLAIRGKTVFSMVVGPAGVGKSSLVRETFASIGDTKGFVAFTKFELINRDRPFANLIEVINQIILQILQTSDREISRWHDIIVMGLEEQHIAFLAQIVPEICLLVGPVAQFEPLPVHEMQNLLFHVMGQFIRLFAKEKTPLFVFLDDLQWCDDFSLNLVKHLMNNEQMGYLHFVASYRNDEVNASHPLHQALEQIMKGPTVVKTVQVTPLTAQDLNDCLTDLIEPFSGDLAHFAMICAQKTLGNPFYFKQFLQYLYHSQLLYLDFSTGKWRCDLQASEQLSATNNVIDLMLSEMRSFPGEQTLLIALAGCIGNRFDIQTLKDVLLLDDETTWFHLGEICRYGFIYPVNRDTGDMITLAEAKKSTHANFQFIHDRIREAASSLLDKKQKQQYNLQIGHLLLKKSLMGVLEKNDKIFAIASHLNMGVVDLPSSEEKALLVTVNLSAARKAYSSAAFLEAYGYIKKCMQYLQNDCWKSQLDMTLSIYNLALETAEITSHYKEAQLFFETITANTSNILDQVEAYEHYGQVLTSQGNAAQAVDLCLNVLSKLGVTITDPHSPAETKKSIQDLAALFDKCVHSKLKPANTANDPYIANAIHLLGKFAAAVYSGKPDLFASWVGTAVRLSLIHGNTPASSFMYACMAAVLINYDEIDKGYAFARYASDLLESYQDPIYRGRTLESVNAHSWHYSEHLTTTLEPLLTAYRIALSCGDHEYAAWNAVFYSVARFYTGAELVSLKKELSAFFTKLNDIHMQNGCFLEGMIWQMVLNLTSEKYQDISLHGSAFNQETVNNVFIPSGNKMALAVFHLLSLQLNYLYGNHKEAKFHMEKALENKDALVAMVMLPILYFFSALTELDNFEQNSVPEQSEILKRVEYYLERLKLWSHYAPMNHLHRVALIEAELLRIKSADRSAIMDAYEKAITAASQNGYINDQALSIERYALYWFFQKNLPLAKTFLKEALIVYKRWGAIGKVSQLKNSYPSLSAQIADDLGTQKILEAQTVIKLSQEIAKEVDIKKLLDKLIRVLLNYTGSTKIALLIAAGGKFKVEALGTSDPTQIHVLLGLELDKCDEIPLGIINYCKRTNRELILNNVEREFATPDAYLARVHPRSILCIPAETPMGSPVILYLENRNTTEAFTSTHHELLRILINQVTISFENAMFYTNLMSSEEKYRGLYENMRDAYAMTDLNGRLIEWNRGFEHLVKYTKVELRKMSFQDLTPTYWTERENQILLKQVLERGYSDIYEKEYCRKDGVIVPIELRTYLIKNEMDQPTRYWAIIRDISERKQSENLLKAAKISAELASRAKSDFLANMSHELRTPLNAIIGFSDLLLALDTDSERKGFLTVISKSGTHLLSIISQMLELSQLESGKLKIQSEVFNPEEVLQEISAAFKKIAHDKNLTLVVDTSGLSVRCEGDVVRIRQILINLIGNAIKFTENGSVTVKASLLETTIFHRWMFQFIVSDTGIGMTPQVESKLFRRFEQGEYFRTKKHPGTGLGLAITKELIDLLQGSISIKTAPDKGTTVTCQIPVIIEKKEN